MTRRRPALLTCVLALSLAVGSALSTAFADEQMKYRIGGEGQSPFTRIEKEDLLISQSCVRSECSAKKALKRASTVGMDFSGGANPGARICRKIGGEVVVGLDERDNQLSFCRFDDGSMVSSGSIYSRALRNDLAR